MKVADWSLAGVTNMILPIHVPIYLTTLLVQLMGIHVNGQVVQMVGVIQLIRIIVGNGSVIVHAPVFVGIFLAVPGGEVGIPIPGTA